MMNFDRSSQRATLGAMAVCGLLLPLVGPAAAQARQDTPPPAAQTADPTTANTIKFVPQDVTDPDTNPNLLFNDIHFHLTNYLHEGLTSRELLEIMQDKVGRVAMFGIPLMQKWDYFINGDRRPGYYLETGAEMYYYSFIDALIAQQYLRLTEKEQERFDPFIVGFNPTDMNAKDHIRNVLLTFPNVFVGIGEFSVHKELVTPKVAGHAASLRNPALDDLMKFAESVGLLVILHCDINEIIPAKGGKPAHLDDLKALFARHPGTNIVYAHTGLGRFVGPTIDHVAILDELCKDDTLRHVYFDISWDEVAKWVVKEDGIIQAWAELLNRYPDRFLFGTDAVSPQTQEAYFKTFRAYEPLWNRLTPEASRAVRLDNYVRLVDSARQRVRTWEARNANKSEEFLPTTKPLALPKAASVGQEPAGSLEQPALTR